MPDFDYKVYAELKDYYSTILRLMKPAETASKEMRDAFENAVEDFYWSEYGEI